MARTGCRKRRYWTVILLYPDYLTDAYGSDIYVAWALTATPEEAVANAQAQAVKAQNGADVDVVDDPADFAMIAVIRGRHRLVMDAMSDWTSPTGPRSGEEGVG